MRIHKFLAQAGVCSRREAERQARSTGKPAPKRNAVASAPAMRVGGEPG